MFPNLFEGLLLKVDQEGEIIWQKAHQIGGPFTDAAETGDGSLLVVGLGGRYGSALVFKVTAGGEVLWRRALLEGTMVQGDIDEAGGGAIVVFNEYPYQAVAWRLNNDGSTAWKYRYGEPGNSIFEAVQHTSDGGFIVAGRTTEYGAQECDGWVLKLDVNGTVAWQNIYGGSEDEYIKSIRQTRDGGYIAVGHAGPAGWVLKLKQDGSPDWSKRIALGDADQFRSVVQNHKGDYLIAGYSELYEPASRRSWAVLLNSTGEPVWQRLYDPGIGLYDVDLADVGGYILSAKSGYALLIRTDSSGNVLDCEYIGTAVGVVSDYPVTVQTSAASLQAVTADARSFNSFIMDDTLVRTAVCPVVYGVAGAGSTDGNCGK